MEPRRNQQVSGPPPGCLLALCGAVPGDGWQAALHPPPGSGGCWSTAAAIRLVGRAA
ncbi:MAG: hypothetical protein LC792_01505 [Actinobacteria bacterium]|nr:hypothetical protein [Actinomycetota bacterium]